MTYDELINKWECLKDKAISSGDKDDMELLESIADNMFFWMAKNQSALANGVIEKMCAINWNNYLTKSESDIIISKMDPKPIWSYQQISDALTQLNLPLEEEPYYNGYALYVAINMIWSDDSDSIASFMGKSKAEVDNVSMLKACYSLAINKLKDKDKVFDIRNYFYADELNA